MSQNSQNISISIKSNPQNLQMVRNEITSLSHAAGFDEEWTGRIVLAIDEAITNIIRHTYKNDPEGDIEITGSADTEAIHISIRDFGPKPDLSKVQSRDLKEVRPGGLGCYFIKEIMDEVEYDIETHDVGTELKLVKKKI